MFYSRVINLYVYVCNIDDKNIKWKKNIDKNGWLIFINLY